MASTPPHSSVLPDSDYDLTFALSNHTDHSLLLTITNSSSVPIASASATIAGGSGFEEQKFTGQDTDPDFGQVFFSSLSELTYDLIATASGYLDFSGNTAISGYTQDQVILNPE